MPDTSIAMKNAEMFMLLQTSFSKSHLKNACAAAYFALRSYQYGNGSPELAGEIADHLLEAMQLDDLAAHLDDFSAALADAEAKEGEAENAL